MIAGPVTIRNGDVQKPVFLNGAAGKRAEFGDPDLAFGGSGQKVPKPFPGAVIDLPVDPLIDPWAGHPHRQKSSPSSRKNPASTALWTSLAPSTSRAWRA